MRSSFIMLVIACLLFTVACSSNSNSNRNDNGSSGQATDSPQSSSAAAPVDPMGKYDPGITINTVKASNTLVTLAQGQTWDDNIWYDLVRDILGISIKNMWVAPVEGQQFEQKLNVTIASGELPDMFEVNPIQFQQLAEDDRILDLTDLYDKYASPLVKKSLNFDNGVSMSAGTIGGKLMGIPRPIPWNDTLGLVYVRKDWLEKYGLQPPQTLDDIWKIARTFVEQQAGGNGTIGIPLRKDLSSDLGGVTQIFNSYHAYPGIWIEGVDGKLVYGSIQPEMKTTLAQLQELYRDGIIDPEFGVKDYGKVCETAISSGKTGIYFGGMADSLGCLSASFLKEQVDWGVYSLVPNDGKPVLTQVNVAPNSYYVVSKASKNPEALIKMLNLYTDVCCGDRSKTSHPDYNPKLMLMTGDDPGAAMHVMPFQVCCDRGNVDKHLLYKDYLADRENTTVEIDSDKQLFDEMDKYLEWKKNPSAQLDQETATAWAFYKIFGPQESTQSYIDRAIRGNLYKINKYMGGLTETMQQKQALLKKTEVDMMTRIITGVEPVDAFDKFVDQWLKLGGDQVTKEVNDWYSNQQ